MAYTLASGVQPEGVDNVPRSILLGLPLIALLLSFGAIHHRNSLDAPVSAKEIPIAAKAIQPGGKNNSSKPGTPSGGSGGSSGAGLSAADTSLTAASGGSNLGATSGGGSTLSSTTTAPTGGTGGGTTSGGGSTTGGTGGSGGTTLPTCSIGQIATVDCVVTACSPPVYLASGQKAILGLDGTCIIVN